MAAVHVRARAALAGIGGAEAGAIASFAPADVTADDAVAAGVVIGDAMVVAAASHLVGDETAALARRAWAGSSVP
jgi:hypothetical protein